MPCNLIIATLISCLATVMLTTSQYMAILLPGEVFRSSYEKANMAPYVLSRTLEDGGTIFSFLVPWSAAAIYSSGVLGVSTLQYLPYAFLPLLCPVFAILCAVTGIGVLDRDGEKSAGQDYEERCLNKKGFKGAFNIHIFLVRWNSEEPVRDMPAL